MATKGGHAEVHHAHFQVASKQDDLGQHDSQILINLGEDRLELRLGFLQVKHVYEVRCTIEDSLGQDVDSDPLENLHVKIDSARPTLDGKGHDLVVVFSAYKEKIMEESVTLRSKSDKSNSLRLTFFARVLGKGKGTPSLKEGIHCIRIDGDEESDASDWQGF